MNFISKTALVAAALLAGAATASADDVLQLDEVFTFGTDFTETRIVYMPVAGDLYFDTSLSQWSFCTLDDKAPDSNNQAGDFENSTTLCWKGLEAGNHTFVCTWVDAGAKGKFFMLDALELLEVNPADGSTVNTTVNSAGDIIFRCNKPVKYTNAYLTTPGGARSAKCLGTITGYSMTQAVRIKSAMSTWYANGTFSPDGGDAFSLVVEGLKTEDGELLDGTGTFTVNYISAPKSLEMSSTNIVDNAAFYSYYPAGDTRAQYSVTFDGPVCTDDAYYPYVELGIGNLEGDGEYYYERVNAVVDGNVVTFDLSGKNRRPDIKLCGDWNNSPLSVKLCSVYDLNHTPALGRYEGNLGSFPFTFVYNELKEVAVDFLFTPDTGSELAGVDKLSVWFNNTQVIQSFEGIEFRYDDGTRDLIAASALTNQASGNEARYTVSVPARAQSEPVTVAVAGVVSLDGYDKHIYADYNQLTALFSSPIEAYRTYTTLAADEVITVELNEVPHSGSYAITDLGNGLTLASGAMTANTYDELEATVATAINFYIGHEYALTINAVAADGTELGTVVIPFSGEKRPAGYSPVEFVSVTPECGLLTADNRTLTLEYSDDVRLLPATSGWIDAAGALQPFESRKALACNGMSSAHAYRWEVVLPVEAIGARQPIEVHVGAMDNDTNPMVVRGDLNTEEANDVKIFLYDAPTGLVTLETATGNVPAGIYTLGGVRVAVAADQLPAGVYIIDGVKVRK